MIFSMTNVTGLYIVYNFKVSKLIDDPAGSFQDLSNTKQWLSWEE